MREGAIKITLLLLLVTTLFGCRGGTIYSENHKMEDMKWPRTQKAEFSPIISDTLSAIDVNFYIRTGSEYNFRNIYLFITTITPSGSMRKDTIEYFLSDEKGVRFGSGVGDVREVELPYRRNVRFSEKGKYRFIVEQGMRSVELKGLYDLGLVIREYRTSK